MKSISPEPLQRRTCWSSMTVLSLASALFITLAGCAATPAGSQGVDAFVKDSTSVVLSGSRAASDAAQCFEEHAKFLPLSEFSRGPGTAQFTYRLRVTDLWFEQVRITPQGPGSRAELRVAPNLDARWLAQLERDRAAPLRRCLGG